MKYNSRFIFKPMGNQFANATFSIGIRGGLFCCLGYGLYDLELRQIAQTLPNFQITLYERHLDESKAYTTIRCEGCGNLQKGSPGHINYGEGCLGDVTFQIALFPNTGMIRIAWGDE